MHWEHWNVLAAELVLAANQSPVRELETARESHTTWRFSDKNVCIAVIVTQCRLRPSLAQVQRCRVNVNQVTLSTYMDCIAVKVHNWTLGTVELFIRKFTREFLRGENCELSLGNSYWFTIGEFPKGNKGNFIWGITVNFRMNCTI